MADVLTFEAMMFLGALSRRQPMGGTRWLGQTGGMTPGPATYPGCRFPAETIRHATWLYHLFGLSLGMSRLMLRKRKRRCPP